MAVDIALINGGTLRQAVANIAQAKGLSTGFFDISDISAESISRELKTNSIVLMNVLEDPGGSLNFFIELRLDRGFRGTGGILSFLPLVQFSVLAGHQMLDTDSCFYLHLPCHINKLVHHIVRRAPLSDCSMENLRKSLGALRIVHQAGTLKHDVGNKLGLALAHLRTLEKLSYFDEPKPADVFKEVRHISLCLTSEKIRDIRRDVEQLCALAENCGLLNDSTNLPVLDNCWTALANWSRLIEETESGIRPSPTETFKRSKLVQSSVKTILERVSYLRESAQQVVNRNV